MYKLYTDKTEIFECNIELEGASLSSSVARLMIESPTINIMFQGKIDSTGKCTIPVKKLKGLLESNTKGVVKLEVIADDTYFVPWSSDFKVEQSKKLTVEVKSQDVNAIERAQPKVTVLSSNKSEPAQPTVKEHIAKLVKLLISENIDITNIHIKKNSVDTIIGTYLTENTIKETQVPTIVNGIIKTMTKIKK